MMCFSESGFRERIFQVAFYCYQIVDLVYFKFIFYIIYIYKKRLVLSENYVKVVSMSCIIHIYILIIVVYVLLIIALLMSVLVIFV